MANYDKGLEMIRKQSPSVAQIEQMQRAAAIESGNIPKWIVNEEPDKPLFAGRWHIDHSALASYVYDQLDLQKNTLSEEQLERKIAEDISIFCGQYERNIVSDTKIAMFVLKSKIAEFSNSDAAQSFSTFSADALLTNSITPVQWIVQDLLPEGLTVLAAPPKSGKSWLTLDLAMNVANGGTFWGKQCFAGDCLLLAVEDSKARLKARLNTLGATNIPRLEFVEPQTAQTLSGTLIEQLQAWCKTKKSPRLIVLDTLGRLKGSSSAKALNAYESDTALYKRLQLFALNHHVAVIAVTHLRKQQRYQPDDPMEMISGSSALHGCADTCIMICGRRFEQEKHILIDGRDLPSGSMDMQAKFDNQTHKWVILGDGMEIAAQQERTKYDQNSIVISVKRMLAERQPLEVTATQLQEYCMKHGLDFPGTPEKIGKTLTMGLIEQLYSYDGIVTSQTRSRTARIYTFSKNQF